MNESSGSVDDIDLHHHTVVEASAGTGKTYTIERLVFRLLTERAIPIDRILVVTFTEKATGELKTRVRGMIERSLQDETDFAPELQTALDNFDQASIFTIHGFCQRLTQEYALEQGQDFRAELVDDVELLEMLLGEVQRKTWRATFGDRLQAVLANAGYNRNTAEAWDRSVIDIAKGFKPRCGHRLLPDFVPDWWRRLDEPGADWNGHLKIFTLLALHEKLAEYKHQRGLQSFDDMIAAVEQSLDPARNPNATTLLADLRKRFAVGIVDEFQDTDPLQWRIFRTVFLEGGSSRLFIVGDPKQAIFAFRGADLSTYTLATAEMKATFKAYEFPLTENWRSDPDLLVALNCVFGDGDWFPPRDRIRYHYVHAPDADKRQTLIEQDRTGRPALSMVDVTAATPLSSARKQFARFVASEIARLLHGNEGGPTLTFSLKGKPARPLYAGDICILIMKHAEAEPILRTLDRAQIPYAFYKQRGLWQSPEALHVQVLLQTLARPDDPAAFRKALLTCFFRVDPAELARCPDLPAQHPARQLYQSWLAFAENRQWSALCRSLRVDTGVLFTALLPAEERTKGRTPPAIHATTLEHLLSTIEQQGHGANLDLLGLLEWIGDLRSGVRKGEENLRPTEGEVAKVQIMTIHASKGLEFPVVFLAGGFTKASGHTGPVSYHDADDRLVFDLRAEPDAEAMDRLNREKEAEQRRLLYVALTRAMFKLYVPKVSVTPRNKPYAGPTASILLPALDLACPEKNSGLVADLVPGMLATTPVPAVPAPAATVAPKATPARSPFTISGPLLPAIDGNLSRRRIVIRSFSSMARHHLSTVGEGASFGEQTTLAGDEATVPIDREDPLRGPVFGDMVHTVLEAIDFAEVGRAETPDALCRVGTHARLCLDRVIRADVAQLRTRTPLDRLEDAARQQIAQLVWNALKTPLADLAAPLCTIPRGDRLHEVEFLFPEQIGPRARRDARPEEAFVTGFMDLLFRKADRYYLLDWKTNLLPAYTREQIERSMAESDYHRQYRLYLHATRRWLERVHGDGFSFPERFAGVYYLYVRGMNGTDESTGVYFHRPTAKDLDLKDLLE